MTSRYYQGAVQESGAPVGSQGNGSPALIQSRSIYDDLSSAVDHYAVSQYAPAGAGNLAPNGVTGYTYSLSIVPESSLYIALLTSFMIDTTPAMVSLASQSANYNLSAFGIANTSQLVITPDWIRNNIIPPRTITLLGRNKPLNLIFTNMAGYNVTLRITAILGVMLASDAKSILTQYGKSWSIE